MKNHSNKIKKIIEICLKCPHTLDVHNGINNSCSMCNCKSFTWFNEKTSSERIHDVVTQNYGAKTSYQ